MLPPPPPTEAEEHLTSAHLLSSAHDSTLTSLPPAPPQAQHMDSAAPPPVSMATDPSALTEQRRLLVDPSFALPRYPALTELRIPVTSRLGEVEAARSALLAAPPTAYPYAAAHTSNMALLEQGRALSTLALSTNSSYTSLLSPRPPVTGLFDNSAAALTAAAPYLTSPLQPTLLYPHLYSGSSSAPTQYGHGTAYPAAAAVDLLSATSRDRPRSAPDAPMITDPPCDVMPPPADSTAFHLVANAALGAAPSQVLPPSTTSQPPPPAPPSAPQTDPSGVWRPYSGP